LNEFNVVNGSSFHVIVDKLNFIFELLD